MPEIKDTGIGWIGKIPIDWDIIKIGGIYSLRNTKVSDRDYPPLSVTMKGILPQLETSAKTNDHDNRKLVKKGDFAINSRSDRRGSCGISDYDGSVSLINTVLKPNMKVVNRYYNWLFHTTEFADEFYKWGHGIVDDLWTTNWQDMKKMSVPYPSVEKQEAIATFLDVQCSEIDTLYADIEKQIDLLEQYKKSVITEAVTRGLDPNVEMKNSGIEWIGNIAVNVVIEPIKFLLDDSSDNIKVGPFGSQLSGNDFLKEESEYWVYNQRNVIDGNVGSGNAFISKEKFIALNGFSVREKDILITTRGTIGKIVRLPSIYHQGVIHPCLIKFRIDETKFNYKLLQFIFNDSDLISNQLLYESNATTIDVMYSSTLKNIRIPVWDMSLQCQIADYLDNKCAEIDSVIADKKKQLETLEAYKKSLIYECVTGKKEV